jgi:hypothetical protein
MTIFEAVDKLRELKRQFYEIEVSREFKGELLFAEWHTARRPTRAKERGAL